MTAKTPGMTKRGSRVEGGGNGTAAAEAGRESPARKSAEAGGEEEGAPVLNEILRHVHYLTSQAEEAQKREREPRMEESDVPAGAAEAPESDIEKPPVPEAPIGAPAEIARALSIQRADFGKWVEMQRRGRRRWLGFAIAAGFPAALVLGVLVQLQFEAIPPHDPTGGWRGHVWENYGQRIVDCAFDAKSRDTAVDCPLVVRWP